MTVEMVLSQDEADCGGAAPHFKVPLAVECGEDHRRGLGRWKRPHVPAPSALPWSRPASGGQRRAIFYHEEHEAHEVNRPHGLPKRKRRGGLGFC